MISIKLNDKATLRVNSSRVIATVDNPTTQTVELYLDGIAVPFRLKSEHVQDVLGNIWGTPLPLNNHVKE